MATPTKADLEARNAELSAQLERAQQRIDQLQEQTGERDELRQVLWIGDELQHGTTRAGKALVRFAGQAARLDKTTGKRHYGAYKNFIAYDNGHGDLAALIGEIHANGNRLVRLTAFETPFKDGSKRSDWTVTSIEAIARVQPAAPAAAAEPSSDAVPF